MTDSASAARITNYSILGGEHSFGFDIGHDGHIIAAHHPPPDDRGAVGAWVDEITARRGDGTIAFRYPPPRRLIDVDRSWWVDDFDLAAEGYRVPVADCSAWAPRPPEGSFLYLDGGSLDIGIWRHAPPTWRTVVRTVIRPWRWRYLRRTVHVWRHPIENDFAIFREAFDHVHPVSVDPNDWWSAPGWTDLRNIDLEQPSPGRAEPW